MKQFTELVAKLDFSMKIAGRGRPCHVKSGDIFVVTNPEHMQDKGLKIARRKTAVLNQGYLLEPAQVMELFDVQPY